MRFEARGFGQPRSKYALVNAMDLQVTAGMGDGMSDKIVPCIRRNISGRVDTLS